MASLFGSIPVVSKSKDKKDKHKRKDLDLINNGHFKAVIVDECHTIGESGSWLCNFLSKLNCQYAIGCTGTVPDEKSKRWNVIGTLGPVIFTEHIHTLQERNQIAKIKIVGKTTYFMCVFIYYFNFYFF